MREKRERAMSNTQLLQPLRFQKQWVLREQWCRQSLGLFISATVGPRQEELEVCPVHTAPTGLELGGR